MKKIAIVTRSLDSGGAERVIVRLIKYALSKDYDVTLFLMEEEHPIFYNLPKECKLNIIKCKNKSGLKRKIESYVNLRKKIKSLKPDVVLSMPEDIGIYVIPSLIGTKIPVVVSERNNPRVMPYKKTSRIIRKIVYPFAKGLIFQTEEAASFFSVNQQNKGIVLPNPIDLDDLPTPYLGAREKIIVGAGRLEEQKNFHLLIDAFAVFYKKHKDYKLIIYGEGSMRNDIENHIKSKSLPESVIQLPGRSNNLAQELKGKAMFVLSSNYEGMPNVLIEAMAVGTPVISTDCPSGGSSNLITNFKSGILVPIQDTIKMAEAMSKLADDKKGANIMAEQALYVRNSLNSQKVCESWIDYLKTKG